MKKIFFVLMFFSAVQLSYATTYVVTNNNNSGAGSLRDAVSKANNDATATSSSPHIIDLRSVSGTITLSSYIQLDNHISFIASLSGNLTISGGNSSSIFYENNPFVHHTLSFDNIIFANSSGTLSACEIWAAKNTFNNCTFRNNTNTGTKGGAAIYNNFANSITTLNNCVFYSNSTTASDGGAIFSNSSLTATNCTFYDNSCPSNKQGSAIYFLGSSTIISCSFANNKNSAAIRRSSFATGLTVKNTILVGNGSAGDINGSVNLSYSIIQNTAGATISGSNNITGSTYSDVFGANNLQNNGGLTHTIELSGTSPAIDAATTSGAPETDQRGYYRTAVYDIGAFEYGALQCATVFAGINQIVCSDGGSVSLDGYVANASGGSWTSSGDGSFGNNTSLNTTYSPGGSDLSSGSVNLTLTSTGDPGGCNPISSTITITFNNPATVNAGNDQTICSNENASLTGSVTGASGGTWTTSGDGSFGNNTALTTSYTPGASDISNGSVTLTLTTTGNPSGCAAKSDNLVLTINQVPIVDAGPDQNVCGNGDISLNGSVTGASGGIWTSSSDGSFANNTSSNTTYTPGSTDISNGSVTLTLTSTANSSGCVAESNLLITIGQPAVVDAGPDKSSCESQMVSLTGVVTGASGGVWSTSGGGFFGNSTSLSTSYFPSYSDILSGSVTLTLTSTGNATGCSAVSDDLILTISQMPTVNAGANQTICSNDAATLNGSVSGTSTVAWTSSGSGSFTSGNSVSDSYTPSAADISAGSVTLTLTATAGTCSEEDDLTLTINICTNNINALGKKLFNIYPNPGNGLFKISNEWGQGFMVEIFNSRGVMVYKGELQNDQELFLPEKGIYFLRCTDENYNVTEKIIVD